MSYISILLYAALSTFQILLAQSYKLLFVPVLLKLWWNHSHKVIFWVGFHLSLGQIHTLSVVWHYLADVKTEYLEQNTEGLLKLPKRCFNLKNEKREFKILLCTPCIVSTYWKQITVPNLEKINGSSTQHMKILILPKASHWFEIEPAHS